MKTLKQILFKNHRESYNQNFITESVKEWLTQKHREHKCGDFCCMEELLEELNQ